MADAGGDRLHHDPAGAGLVDTDLLDDQRFVQLMKDGGFHDGLLSGGAGIELH